MLAVAVAVHTYRQHIQRALAAVFQAPHLKKAAAETATPIMVQARQAVLTLAVAAAVAAQARRATARQVQADLAS